MSFDINEKEKNCKFCDKAKKLININEENLKNEVNEIYIDFTGEIDLKLGFDGRNFMLIAEWLGCPEYLDNVCQKLNGNKNSIIINYCPICGKKLSVERFRRNKN